MPIKELTANNFDQTIESNGIIVIDFWAQWCGPCKIFGKIMTEVSEAYLDVTFASVDIEIEKALVEEFAVRSIPFVMIIRNRVVVYAESGLLPAAGLRDLIEKTKAINPNDFTNKKAVQ